RQRAMTMPLQIINPASAQARKAMVVPKSAQSLQGIAPSSGKPPKPTQSAAGQAARPAPEPESMPMRIVPDRANAPKPPPAPIPGSRKSSGGIPVVPPLTPAPTAADAPLASAPG